MIALVIVVVIPALISFAGFSLLRTGLRNRRSGKKTVGTIMTMIGSVIGILGAIACIYMISLSIEFINHF